MNHSITDILVLLFSAIVVIQRSVEGGRARNYVYTTQTAVQASTAPKYRRTFAPTPIPSELGRKIMAQTLVPHFIDFAPLNRCNVTYPSGAIVDAGNFLTLDQIKEKPNITWIADFRWYYSVMFRDADEPIDGRNWHTWLMINIPGNDTECGEVVLDYGLPKLTKPGLHRFVFLVFRQPLKIVTDTVQHDIKDRGGVFKLQWFIDDYSLLYPSLGNFFLLDYKPSRKQSPKYTRRNLSLLLTSPLTSPSVRLLTGEESLGDFGTSENLTLDFDYDIPRRYML